MTRWTRPVKTETCKDPAGSRLAGWRRSSLAIVATLSLTGTGLLTGCASFDKHHYESRLDSPKTLEVIDKTTGDVLWAMDIPVDHTLKTDMNRDQGGEIFKAGEGPAKTMKFKLVNNATGDVVDEGEVQLTGYPVHLVKIEQMADAASQKSVVPVPQDAAPEPTGE